MLSKLNEKLWFKSLLWGLFGVFSSILISVCDFIGLSLESLKQFFLESGTQIITLIAISSIYCFIFTFFGYFLGSKAKKYCGIEECKIDKIGKILFLSIGIIVPIILYLLDVFVYYGKISNFIPITFNPFELIGTVLYSGVVEEIWFRYGIATCMIVVFHKAFVKEKKELKVDKRYIILGSVFTVLFLFSFQLQSVTDVFDSRLLVALRAFVNYCVMNLVYTYFYLRYSLKWSILLHVLFLTIYTGLCPLVLSLIG